MKSFINYIPLTLIILISIWSRTIYINQIPQSALIDEAHFGYIAQSLLQTGKDEHGIRWPILFKGFGDQKLPLYGYSLIPFVQAYGLGLLTIRLPSILAGIFLVIVSYFIGVMLFKSRWAGINASVITAVSPWSFFLSRFGFEANLALLLFAIGMYALFKFFQTDSSKDAGLAGLFLAATWYAYIAFRPVTLILILSCLIWLIIKKKITYKSSGLLLLFFGIGILPWFLPGLNNSNGARFTQVGIFGDVGLGLEINEQRTYCDSTASRWWCDVNFNKPILISKILIDRYLTAFSPNFLALNGEPNEKFLTLERFGQFYPIYYPFFLLGLFTLIKNRKVRIEWRWLVYLGIFLAPLPAIIAGDPQKVRLTPWYIFVVIMITAGIEYVINLVKVKKLKIVGQLSLLAISLIYFISYLTFFFTIHFYKHDASYQSYAPEISRFISLTPNNALVLIHPFYSDPLMFHAFYSGMDPRLYQQTAVLGNMEPSGFQHTVELGHIETKPWEPDTIACEALKKGYETAYLITDRKYSSFRTIFESRSANQVHVYVRMYAIPKTACPTYIKPVL